MGRGNRQGSAHTHVCSSFFLLSEKLKKQAEKDKGKQRARGALRAHP